MHALNGCICTGKDTNVIQYTCGGRIYNSLLLQLKTTLDLNEYILRRESTSCMNTHVCIQSHSRRISGRRLHVTNREIPFESWWLLTCCYQDPSQVHAHALSSDWRQWTALPTWSWKPVAAYHQGQSTTSQSTFVKVIVQTQCQTRYCSCLKPLVFT